MDSGVRPLELGIVLYSAPGSLPPPYGPWPHVPPHVWADVQEEIHVDDDGDDGEVCALCCMKKSSLSKCDASHLHHCGDCLSTHTCGDELMAHAE